MRVSDGTAHQMADSVRNTDSARIKYMIYPPLRHPSPIVGVKYEIINAPNTDPPTITTAERIWKISLKSNQEAPAMFFGLEISMLLASR